MARKIVITSGKGGVGKTTITANLGIALAKMALRVVIVDLDLGLNNLDLAVEAESKITFNLYDVICGRCRVRQALVQDKSSPSLFLLPCSHNVNNVITKEDIQNIVRKLNDMFDYVLLDCPAGIDIGFTRAISSCDEAIIVCTPHLASIRDADKVNTALRKFDLLDVKLLVNRMRGDLVLEGKMLDAFEIFSLLECKPLGIIEEDDTLNCTGYVGHSDDTFDIIANNLHNGKADMIDYITKYRGLNRIRVKRS